MVECSTTLNCSSDSELMSARECCVNSVGRLAYTIPESGECHTCIGMSSIFGPLLIRSEKHILSWFTVFGWLQDNYEGPEMESAQTVQAGYLKGAEIAGVDIPLNVEMRLSTASNTN